MLGFMDFGMISGFRFLYFGILGLFDFGIIGLLDLSILVFLICLSIQCKNLGSHRND